MPDPCHNHHLKLLCCTHLRLAANGCEDGLVQAAFSLRVAYVHSKAHAEVAHCGEERKVRTTEQLLMVRWGGGRVARVTMKARVRTRATDLELRNTPNLMANINHRNENSKETPQ